MSWWNPIAVVSSGFQAVGAAAHGVAQATSASRVGVEKTEGSPGKVGTLLLVCALLAWNTQVAMAFPPIEAPFVVKLNILMIPIKL
jgi:hypothetical protein